MKNKDHAKFLGANKLHYGRCASAHRNYRVKSLNEKTSSCSYRCSSRKKAWKNSGFYRIWILNSAIPVQHSTIFWVNKPAGSKLLSRFVIKPWKDADEIMNVWKLYMGTAGWRIHWKKIINYRPNCCSWEKNAWKKNRLMWVLNPWPLWYRCNALPIELTSQLRASPPKK